MTDLTPLQKARLAQQNTPRKEVFHTVRTNSGSTKELKLTRGLAIKLMCTECMGFEQNPVECTEKLCPLYPYRKKTLAAYDKKQDSVCCDEIDKAEECEE